MDRLKPDPRDGESAFGLSAGDRRMAYSRQASFHQSYEPPHTPISIHPEDPSRPFLSRNASTIDSYEFRGVQIDGDGGGGKGKGKGGNVRVLDALVSFLGSVRYGNKYMRKLFWLISLNVAYSTTELGIGLFTGRVGLVSDAFHLTFGCGLLTFSLFAMAASRKKPDQYYTYGYRRLEVLSAFTNAIFLLFMSFSLAVEALHAFVQDESEHKHYLIVSAVTNLIVNLIGVWFFRNYARVNLVYRRAEDMNYHSVCLHVLADSIRRLNIRFVAPVHGVVNFALVQNAEVLCLGLVSVAVFTLVKPLFKASGGILLQMASPGIHTSALSKCWRQVTSREHVSEISQARFWELVPGHTVGSISVQVKNGSNDQPVVQFMHNLYNELGIQDLTVQADIA